MKYKILIGKNAEEFERILRILLANGHVFTSKRRFRTFEDVITIMSNGIHTAQWFVIGYTDCKNVVGTMRLASDEADRYQIRVRRNARLGMTIKKRLIGLPTDYQDITLEDYLKLRASE